MNNGYWIILEALFVCLFFKVKQLDILSLTGLRIFPMDNSYSCTKIRSLWLLGRIRWALTSSLLLLWKDFIQRTLSIHTSVIPQLSSKHSEPWIVSAGSDTCPLSIPDPVPGGRFNSSSPHVQSIQGWSSKHVCSQPHCELDSENWSYIRSCMLPAYISDGYIFQPYSQLREMYLL